MNSVLTNTSELPEDYPARLFLDIRPVGDAPPPGSCKLTILGLEEELSFELKPQSTSADVSASSHGECRACMDCLGVGPYCIESLPLLVE